MDPLGRVPPALAAVLRPPGPPARPGLALWAPEDLVFTRIPGTAAVVLFGHDEHGDRFALGLGDGRVYRIREADFLDGVFRGPGVTVVAAGLAEFLARFGITPPPG